MPTCDTLHVWRPTQYKEPSSRDIIPIIYNIGSSHVSMCIVECFEPHTMIANLRTGVHGQRYITSKILCLYVIHYNFGARRNDKETPSRYTMPVIYTIEVRLHTCDALHVSSPRKLGKITSCSHAMPMIYNIGILMPILPTLIGDRGHSYNGKTPVLNAMEKVSMAREVALHTTQPSSCTWNV